MSKYLWITLIPLFVLCVFSKKISGHLTKKTTKNNYDMDDFINQLLSSQKFDELADKIAEKAVQKMKSVTLPEKFLKQKTPAKQSEVAEGQKENDNESVEEEDNQKRVMNKESAETLQHRQNKSPYQGDQRSHKVVTPVKINTHALLKKDDNSEQGELSLKYEYLKKHAHDEKSHNQREIGSNEPNPWQHLEHSKTKEKRRPSEDENYEHHSVSSENNNNYGAKNTKTNSYSHNAHVRNSNKKEYNEVRPKQDYDFISRPQFKSEKVPSLPVIDIEVNGERKIVEPTDEPSGQKSASNEEVLQDSKIRKSRRGTISKDSVVEVEKSDSEVAENTHDSVSNPAYELGELTTTKKVIRKEGNRYYTYLSGPEYEEFHQQIANERKKEEEVK